MRTAEHALFERGVGALETIARVLTMYGRKIVAEVDDLVKAAQANNNVEASAIQVIQGLGVKLADAIAKEGTIPDDVKARLTEVTDSINNSSAALAAAITANTPAAPAAPAPDSAQKAEVK